MVWVVPLSREPWAGWPESLTPVAEIEQHRVYHYPIRAYYPGEVPEVIAFRYDGEVKSIHRVESYARVTSPYPHIPGAPNLSWDEPHYLIKLGPAKRPPHRIATGKGIYGPARHWVDEGILLNSSSLADAMRRSRTLDSTK
jgi:hypothetical protein